MLTLCVPEIDLYDEEKEEFVNLAKGGCTINFEHSLMSISKWESKWKKPFIGDGDDEGPKTAEELIDYVKCMVVNKNVDERIIDYLPQELFVQIKNYIETPQTATKFYDMETGKPKKKERITSEKLYAYMVMYRIPWEAQKWHISRLMNVLEYCGKFNTPPSKTTAKQRALLNKANRAKFKTKG